MRAIRAVLVASLLACAAAAVPVAPDAVGAQQLGAVTVDRDGWWDRAGDPGRPITSPGLPFEVPGNALAVSASGGEPDKVAAVGVLLDVDPDAFQRLILSVTESAEPGANVGSPQAVIQACAITSSWAPVEKGAWAGRPTADQSGCVDGVRSPDGVWRFDLSSFARRWLDGSLEPNGVLLVEKVNPPVTFQVAVGDRSTTTMTFLLDVTPSGDTGASGDGAPSSAGSGDDAMTGDDLSTSTDDATFDDTAGADSFVYTGADAFTVPEPAPAAEVPQLATPAASSQRDTEPALPEPTKGKLPLATLLLIPIALGLAVVISASLNAEPDAAAAGTRREGGVSRVMRQRKDQES